MQHFDVFHGQVTFANAQIYVRATDFDGRRGLRLSGHVHGPHCIYGRMLPAKSPLRDLGSGDNPLAAAILQDPCIWTAEMPVYYKVVADLCDGERVVASIEQMYGVLAIGARNRSIQRSGKRWVPRGIDQNLGLAAELSDWRDAATVMVARAPDNDLCRGASEKGVFLIVACRAGDELIDEIRGIARWPAVAIIAILGEPADPAALRSAAPNVLLGKIWGDGDREGSSWHDVLFCRADDIGQALHSTADVPLIAVDLPGDEKTPEAARQACADLQRRLTIHGDFAGYLTSEILFH